MGEILGLGLTHYPPLIGLDENMAGILRTVLKDPGLPERYRDPASWPEAMRREYGDDGGTASAAAHRESLVNHFRHARKLLDDFQPDVVVIWGDDQHENFTEDVIPPFCVQAYDQVEARHRARDTRRQRLGRGPRQGLPHQRASRGRQVPGAATAGAGRGHGVLLQAAAPPGPRPRLPQHGAVPRLRPRRLSVSGRHVPGELLRPARDRPAGRPRQPGQPARPTPSSIRRRPRPSGAWRSARRRRARCARARGARR